MKSTKYFLAALSLLAALAFNAKPAQAAVFSVFYNPAMTMPSTGTGGFNAIGFGLSGFFGNRVGLEIGGSYQNQLANGTASPNIHAPILFRAWLGKVVGLGLGGFIDYQLSGLAGRTALSYGLAADLKFVFGGGNTKFFVGGGYAYGLARVQGTTTESSLQMKLGVQFGGAK